MKNGKKPPAPWWAKFRARGKLTADEHGAAVQDFYDLTEEVRRAADCARAFALRAELLGDGLESNGLAKPEHFQAVSLHWQAERLIADLDGLAKRLEGSLSGPADDTFRKSAKCRVQAIAMAEMRPPGRPSFKAFNGAEKDDEQ